MAQTGCLRQGDKGPAIGKNLTSPSSCTLGTLTQCSIPLACTLAACHPTGAPLQMPMPCWRASVHRVRSSAVPLLAPSLETVCCCKCPCRVGERLQVPRHELAHPPLCRHQPCQRGRQSHQIGVLKSATVTRFGVLAHPYCKLRNALAHPPLCRSRQSCKKCHYWPCSHSP